MRDFEWGLEVFLIGNRGLDVFSHCSFVGWISNEVSRALDLTIFQLKVYRFRFQTCVPWKFYSRNSETYLNKYRLGIGSLNDNAEEQIRGSILVFEFGYTSSSSAGVTINILSPDFNS